MADFTDLDVYFRDLTAQDRFSGVVLVTQGEKPLFSGAYGYASRAWRAPCTLETRFDTASITKLFTATAVFQMIEQGRLSLETKAVEYLGLQDTAISPDVNIHHLLTHSSGISDDADEENDEDYAALYLIRPNYTVTQASDFLPQFAYKPANFPPGAGCRYNNCGYVLLGMMVEKASGLAYREYVQRNVFERAGMDRSGFFHLGDVNEQTAEGADPQRDEQGKVTGWKRNIYSFPPVGTPDGGAYVTAADLDRFLRALLSGELVSADWARAFQAPQVIHRKRDTWTKMYGFGPWFYVDLDGKVVFFEKEGQNPGVSGLIRRYPAQDINVVLLSNLGDGAWEPIRKIHESVLSQ